jgi:hypothetical protein
VSDLPLKTANCPENAEHPNESRETTNSGLSFVVSFNSLERRLLPPGAFPFVRASGGFSRKPA